MRPIACHGLIVQRSRLVTAAERGKLNFPRTSAFITRRFTSTTAATLIYPEPPTNNHRDLASFLDYADRSGLDETSTLYVGTHYEYTVAQTLSRFGFYLQRVGGHSDYGIDLLGTWSAPSSKEPLKVLLQCKAITRKSSPNLVRELEGAFVGAPIGWRGRGVLGIFVTENPATKGVRDSLGRSRWPMGFISCTRGGHVQQMMWNRRAQEEGLEGLGVGMQYDQVDGASRLLLTWKGKCIPVVRIPRKLASSFNQNNKT